MTESIDNYRQKYADHEIIWIVSASTLPWKYRKRAFWDIAQMAGRTMLSVHLKANKLARGDIPKSDASLVARYRAQLVASQNIVNHSGGNCENRKSDLP